MISQPEKLQRTPLKEDIEHIFKETTIIATSLQHLVSCKCPGNKNTAFWDFNKKFNALFGLSWLKKELDNDVIKQCEDWFNLKKKHPTDANISRGLKLFKIYSKELFNKGLIKYG